MRFMLFTLVLAVVLTVPAFAEIPEKLPPGGTFRLQRVYVTRVDDDYHLVFNGLGMKRDEVMFSSLTSFVLVEHSKLDGTYVNIIREHDPEGRITKRMVTIYVRNYTTKRVWERIIERYQPRPAKIPVDVLPTEYAQ